MAGRIAGIVVAVIFVCAMFDIGVYCFRHGNSSDGAAGRIAEIVVAVVFVCAMLSIGFYCFRHGNSSDGVAGRIAGIIVAVIFVCAMFGIGIHYARNFEKVGRAYCFWLVCLSVCVCVRLFRFEWSMLGIRNFMCVFLMKN